MPHDKEHPKPDKEDGNEFFHDATAIELSPSYNKKPASDKEGGLCVPSVFPSDSLLADHPKESANKRRYDNENRKCETRAYFWHTFFIFYYVFSIHLDGRSHYGIRLMESINLPITYVFSVGRP